MKCETTKSCKLGRYMKAPIRILSKARDLYVRSLTNCSGRMPYSAAIGCPAGVVYTLPKSFSVNSSSRSSEDEDIRVLMQITLSNPKSTSRREEASPLQTSGGKGFSKAKSFSVGVIGRIDEDEPCHFTEDFKVDTDKVLYSRSRSYAVTKRR